MLTRQFACFLPRPLEMLLIFAGILGFGGVEAMGQFRKPMLQKSAVVLDTNTEVVKRLATVEDHVKERQWEQAILILQKVTADHGDSLIAVSADRYLNVTTYCNSILANFPPAGLAVYREKHDAQAKQWLEQGLAARDSALLEKVVQKAFISRSGDEALYWLGEWAWDHGNFSAARDYWRKLLKLPNPPDAGQPQPVLRYPDSTRSQAEVLSRIVLCHLMEGNQKLAERWLGYLKEQHPEARGHLAGKDGVLVEILSEVLDKSRSWNFPEPQGNLPTFAGNSQRDFRYPKPAEVGGVQWEIPLPDHGHDPASPRNIPPKPSLSYFPVIVNNTLFFCDPDRIYALDALTGRAKWPLAGEGVIANRDDLQLAAIYQSPVPTLTRQKYRVGVPRFTLTVHEDRLYARMGSPVTGQVSSTLSSNGHLVCLDLSKEGKLVWTCEPDAVVSGSKLETKGQWAFEGTPIVDGGRVFVGLRRSHSQSQTESALACLDAETGKTQWIHAIASARSSVAEQQNFISHHLATLGENMVFYMPEFGVVTALDASNGRQLWAVTYSSYLPKESPILDEPRKQGLTPCVFHQGVIYAAPTDSDVVLAISAKTGLMLWERRIPFPQDQIRHVLGVVDNQLVLSGNYLWILNATTGNIVYPDQFLPGRHPEFDGYGRGLIAGDEIFWPTRSKIEVRNLLGQRTQQPEPCSGGNLAIAGEMLIVAEPRRLVAYSDFARVRKTQIELLSQNPKAALPRWRLGQVAEATGDLSRALDLYEQTLTWATPEDRVSGQPLRTIASESRLQILVRLGKQALAKPDPKAAIDHFRRAASLADEASTRGEALKFLAAAFEEAEEFEQAVATYQSLLETPALANQAAETKTNRTLGEFAKSQIDQLIQKHGRGVYAAFDQLAAEKIQDLLKQQDLEGMDDLLRQFPNAEISSETRHQLAHLKRDQGHWWEAVANWQELLEESLERETRQHVLLQLARTLDQHGYYRPARDYWQRIGQEFPAAQVPVSGNELSAVAFVPRHLHGENYRNLDRIAPPLPLMRTWEKDISPEAHVVLPVGKPPGPTLACLLMENRELVCLNQADAQTRWRKQLNHHIIWAAYGQTHLLLGTTKSLLAVALESGATLWQFTINDAPTAPGFEQIGEQVVVVSGGNVTSLQANTGRQIWQTQLAGRLSANWYADADFLVLQTDNPLRIHVLQTATGRRLSEHHFGDAWTSPPVRFQASHAGVSKPGFVVAMYNKQIRAFSAFDSQADPAWIYNDATSYANTPPQFWAKGNHLVMLMDGDTLIKLDPKTGEKLWATPLAQVPLSQPDRSIVLDDKVLYAAEGHALHCVRLEDGATVWKQPLPRVENWSLEKQDRFLIAMPHDSAEATTAVIFNAQTGERTQELKIEPHVIAWSFQGMAPVLFTPQKLRGWGPLGFFGEAN